MSTPVTANSITPSMTRQLWLVLLSVVLLGGCSSVYYNTMEKLGFEKRDILVDRVENARDSQNEAQETFRSSLERFQSVVDTPDTDLKERYAEISDAYEDSKSSAEDVRDRINKVEDVAEALFDEWEDELELYSDSDLKRRSENILRETRRRYERMMTAMHRAETSMAPVLDVFQDQVLFLKHNLNSLAIAAIRDELADIEQITDELIAAMNQSISEARSFIEALE